MPDELLSVQEFYINKLQALATESNMKAYNNALEEMRTEGEDALDLVRLAGMNYYKLDNTAYLAIRGYISKDWSFETWISGGRPLTHLVALFDDAEQDESIDTIQLMFDTPGGSVSGVSEFFDIINNSSKKVLAHAQGTLASAGYWLASAADSITATKTSIVGSVGVMLELVDRSKMDSERGIKRYTYKSTGAEMKNVEPGSKKADEHYQAYVDSVFDIMKGDIAKGRGIDPNDVADKYGNGAVFVASEAVSRGMIDKINNKSILADAKDSSVEESIITRGIIMADKKVEALVEAPIATATVVVDEKAILASERKRVSDISALGYGEVTAKIVEQAIAEGWEVGVSAIAINKVIVEHSKAVAVDRTKDAEVLDGITGSLEGDEDIPDTTNAIGMSTNAINKAMDRELAKMKGDK